MPFDPDEDARNNWDIDLPKRIAPDPITGQGDARVLTEKEQMEGPAPKGQRVFSTGAMRDQSADKIDLEGFINPATLEVFGQYMHFHRHMADGTMRASDNWQKGIPTAEYVKSLIRHVMDIWMWKRKGTTREGILFACCGVLFNTFGIINNILQTSPAQMYQEVATNEEERAFKQTFKPFAERGIGAQGVTGGKIGYPGS